MVGWRTGFRGANPPSRRSAHRNGVAPDRSAPTRSAGPRTRTGNRNRRSRSRSLMGWPIRWWVGVPDSGVPTHHLVGQPMKWGRSGQVRADPERRTADPNRSTGTRGLEAEDWKRRTGSGGPEAEDRRRWAGTGSGGWGHGIACLSPPGPVPGHQSWTDPRNSSPPEPHGPTSARPPTSSSIPISRPGPTTTHTSSRRADHRLHFRPVGLCAPFGAHKGSVSTEFDAPARTKVALSPRSCAMTSWRRAYQLWATSTTTRLVVPGPVSVKTRNGSRARTPSPIVVSPSKLPALTTCRKVR